MATTTFDKLAFIDALKNSSVPEEQARAHASALDSALRETVATKSDIQGLDFKIQELKVDLLKWIVPLLLGQAALVAALVRLF